MSGSESLPAASQKLDNFLVKGTNDRSVSNFSRQCCRTALYDAVLCRARLQEAGRPVRRDAEVRHHGEQTEPAGAAGMTTI